MILRVESFDHWITADASKKAWQLSVSSGVSAGNGRNSTASLRATNPGPNGSSTLSVSNSGRDGVCGFAFRCPSSLPVDFNTNILTIKEGSIGHLFLQLLTTGALRVTRDTTTLGTSGTTPIAAATYYFIEFAWNLHDSTGTYDVRVNGISVVSGSSADTQFAGTGIWNGLQFWGNNGSTSHTSEIDDLYVADNTTFLGDHRIVAVVASTGNGTKTDWTCSTGSDHGALVDEASPNITDYVSSSTAGHIDTFNFAAVGVAGTVAGVQTNLYSKADVAGVRTVAPAFRIGGADYVGTGAVLGSDWAYLTEFAAVSPATATAWTVSEIDGAEFGAKVTV